MRLLQGTMLLKVHVIIDHIANQTILLHRINMTVHLKA